MLHRAVAQRTAQEGRDQTDDEAPPGPRVVAHHVEQAVVGDGPGGDLDATALAARAGDADHPGVEGRAGPVRDVGDGRRPHERQQRHRCRDIDERAPSVDSVGLLVDRGGEAQGGDREEGLSVDVPEIHPLLGPGRQRGRGAQRVQGDAQVTAQIVTAAAGQGSEDGAGPGHARRGRPQRAVAAQHDQHVVDRGAGRDGGDVLEGLARDDGGVGIRPGQSLSRLVRQRGAATHRPAGRVDQQDDGHARPRGEWWVRSASA